MHKGHCCLESSSQDLKKPPEKALILGIYGDTLLPSLKDELGCNSVLQTDIFSISNPTQAKAL